MLAGSIHKLYIVVGIFCLSNLIGKDSRLFDELKTLSLCGCPNAVGPLRRLIYTTSRARSVVLDVQGSVAKSTHAGISLPRFISQRLGPRVHFWPFDGWEIRAVAPLRSRDVLHRHLGHRHPRRVAAIISRETSALHLRIFRSRHHLIASRHRVRSQRTHRCLMQPLPFRS